MDKDNKYYEIIKNLVENNKKYVDYEDILEDIIDDVYSHSQTVINSINDNAVIEGYLTKVVSTSLITVPKKLGIKKKVEEPAPYVPISVPPVQEIKVNTEYVDRMINGTVSNVNQVQTLKKESQAEIEEITDESAEKVDIQEMNVVELQTDDTKNVIDNEEIIERDSLQADYVTADIGNEGNTEQEFSQAEEDNLILIENDADIINEQQKEEVEQNFEENELEPSDIFELSNDADAIERFDQISDNKESSLETDLKDSFDEVVELDLNQQEESEEVYEVENDDTETVDLFDAEKVDNSKTDSTETSLSENEATEGLILEAFPADSEIAENAFVEDLINIAEDKGLGSDDDLIEEVQEDDLSLLQEDFSLDSINETEQADDFLMEEDAQTVDYHTEQKVLDFSSFEGEFNKEKDYNVDKEEVTNRLNKLIASQINANLARIYDLKYNQNLGIRQIASELGITEDAVAGALKEIVDIL